MLDATQLKRRIDAARTLRGLRQEDLAALFIEEGHGKHDLGRLERGKLPLTGAFRRSLALILRVPESWFTADDVDSLIAEQHPAPVTEDVLAAIAHNADMIESMVSAQAHAREHNVSQAAAVVVERLENVANRRDANSEKNAQRVLDAVEGLKAAVNDAVADRRLQDGRVNERLANIEDTLNLLVAGAELPAPRGELGHRVEGSQPSAQDPRQDETRPADDSQQGNDR